MADCSQAEQLSNIQQVQLASRSRWSAPLKAAVLHIVSSDAFSEEKMRTMRAFGAQITLVPSFPEQVNRNKLCNGQDSGVRFDIQTLSICMLLKRLVPRAGVEPVR